jgi:hypothetical protein
MPTAFSRAPVSLHTRAAVQYFGGNVGDPALRATPQFIWMVACPATFQTCRESPPPLHTVHT